MEQQFQLKYYGQMSIFEQDKINAEDRAWWINRIQKEIKETAERERQQISSARSSRR